MGKSYDADKGFRLPRWWALLCCIGIIAIPVAIHLLYLFGERYPLVITPWSAGEMLSYCGTLAAAAIAILGVYWGFWFSKQAQERQIRDEAAPFFSAVFLTQRNKRSAFGEVLRGRLTAESGRVDCGNGDSGDRDEPYARDYEESDIREVYVVLDGEISYRRHLNDDQQKHVQSSDLLVQSAPGTYSFEPNSVTYIPVNLINVGRGVAISTRVGINPKHDDWEGVYYLTVEPGDSFYVGIYIDTGDEKVCGEYELRLTYFDYLGCLYMQRFELNVLRESADGGVSVQMAYYGPRELLSDEERERYLYSLGKSPISF